MMWKWLTKKLEIDILTDLIEYDDQRISAIESAIGKGFLDHHVKLIQSRHSMRYDEIERDRSRRKKAHA